MAGAQGGSLGAPSGGVEAGTRHGAAVLPHESRSGGDALGGAAGPRPAGLRAMAGRAHGPAARLGTPGHARVPRVAHGGGTRPRAAWQRATARGGGARQRWLRPAVFHPVHCTRQDRHHECLPPHRGGAAGGRPQELQRELRFLLDPGPAEPEGPAPPRDMPLTAPVADMGLAIPDRSSPSSRPLDGSASGLARGTGSPGGLCGAALPNPATSGGVS